MESWKKEGGRSEVAAASELRDRLGQAKRKRDAKMVVLRLLVDAYKWNKNQFDEWKDVSEIAGVETNEVQEDIFHVIHELKCLMKQLRLEVDAIKE